MREGVEKGVKEGVEEETVSPPGSATSIRPLLDCEVPVDASGLMGLCLEDCDRFAEWVCQAKLRLAWVEAQTAALPLVDGDGKPS